MKPSEGNFVPPEGREGTWKKHARQFTRFALIGASGILVNMALGAALLHMPGLEGSTPILTFDARHAVRFRSVVFCVSFLGAAVSNYQLNRMWTFTGTRPRWLHGLISFLSVSLVSMALGALLQWQLTHHDSPIYLGHPFFENTAGLHSRDLWAQLMAVIVTTPVNFTLNKLWTFRRREATAAGASQAQ